MRDRNWGGNSLRGFGIDGALLMKRKVKIYDVDKKKLIKECESICEASEFTGIPKSYFNGYIKSKSKNKKNKLNLTLTFR